MHVRIVHLGRVHVHRCASVCYLADVCSSGRSSCREQSGSVMTLAERENLSYSEGEIR